MAWILNDSYTLCYYFIYFIYYFIYFILFIIYFNIYVFIDYTLTTDNS